MNKKIIVITDDNSGFNKEEANKLNIKVLKMPIIIDGEVFFENETITKEEFFDRLNKNEDISTSQPSPGIILEMWENLLKEYDYILHIPMSSGLSASCQTALSLAEEKEFKDKVFVIDNHRISVTLKQSVYDAITLINKGLNPKEIKEKLESEASNASIYISVDTLKYLKKGGRITPSAALIGEALHIKPVLQLFGGKLDSYKKCLGTKQAVNALKTAIKNDLETKFKDYSRDELVFSAAYTGKDDTIIKKVVEEIKEELNIDTPIIIDHLSLSVSTHIGEGALALTISKKVL